jgi:hypothetical protein
MAPNPPQKLSVKRKRNDPAPDTLRVEEAAGEAQEPGLKRQKSEMFTWRLISKPGNPNTQSQPSPQPLAQPSRQYTFSTNRVLVEHRQKQHQTTTNGVNTQPITQGKTPASIPPADPATPRPRKLPGAGTALRGARPGTDTKGQGGHSEEQIREFEQFAAEVEEDEKAKSQPPATPSRFKPRVPALRYKDRHPERAAALASQDPDAMDIDDYVIDTYIREVVMPDANGKMPEPQGTVGIIVLSSEDDEFWNGEDDSDREFETDDEDENAEEYYANDYPEDEMSSDDEFDRDLYKRSYRKGSDDEEYDLNASSGEEGAARSDGDEDDEHFRRMMTAKV